MAVYAKGKRSAAKGVHGYSWVLAEKLGITGVARFFLRDELCNLVPTGS